MRAVLCLLGLGLLAALADGVSEGRRANEALRMGDLAAAESLYMDALALPDVRADVGARLANNLGLALARQAMRTAGGPPGSASPSSPPLSTAPDLTADSAFTRSLAGAADPELRARVAYNAGTAALLTGDAALAVAHLRRALILAPADTSAQRNYEIARRRLGGDDAGTPSPPEPSEFARRVKAQADSLVAAQHYGDALRVMQRGLARDSTVAAFHAYTQRLAGVTRIERADSLATADSLQADSLNL